VERRIAWDALPGPLKRAIGARTEPISAVRIAAAGQNSPLAAIIDTSNGKVFAKGLPSGHRRVITQASEAAVAPLVGEISPALLWHLNEAGWNVLGYEASRSPKFPAGLATRASRSPTRSTATSSPPPSTVPAPPSTPLITRAAASRPGATGAEKSRPTGPPGPR
jgi:hypothetical protein